jgi:hypothetical protein
MIKTQSTQQTEMSLEALSDYNKSMFFDESIPLDDYTALTDATAHHITTAELTDTLKHRFQANKSSGLSKMPLELLKHLGPAGISSVAELLNVSAID